MSTSPNDATVLIRPEQPALYDAISEVHRAAFERPDEARLVATLRQSRDFNAKLSLMALFNGQVVGHVLFSKVTLQDAEHINAYALAPMGVLPAFQGQFVGSALIYEGLEACRRQKIELLCVLGHADYFARFGFRTASQQGEGIGNTFGVDDAFMVQELKRGILEGVSGTIIFPPQFDAVE